MIDFGLAEKFLIDNVHRAYEEDERRANNGTREFRSRDAHIGVISRRSDMESLGWNLIIWLYGRHPWDPLLKCEDAVYEKKCWAMKNIPQCLEEAFSDSPLPEFKVENKSSSKRGKKTAKQEIVFEKPERTYQINTVVPKGLDKYFNAIEKMQYDERPNYVALKDIIMSIAKLNPTKSEDASPVKKAKVSNTKAAKGSKVTKSKSKSSANLEPEVADDEVDSSHVKVNGRSRRAASAATLLPSSTVVEPSLPPPATTRVRNGRAKATTKSKASKNDENILENGNSDVIAEIVETPTKKTNGEKHHEPKKSGAVNGRPKRGTAAAAQALAESNESSPEKSPDKHAVHLNGGEKRNGNHENDEDTSETSNDNITLGRFPKRLRTSTYLHELSFTDRRSLRRQPIRSKCDSDSEDDNDKSITDRRIYIGNRLSVSKRSPINGKNNSLSSLRSRETSLGDDSYKDTTKSDDDDDDEDDDNDNTTIDNDLTEDDDDDMPFGQSRERIEDKKLASVYPLTAKNGRNNGSTDVDGTGTEGVSTKHRFETQHMIKLREKLALKKAAASKGGGGLTASENGHKSNNHTKASNGASRNGS